METVIFWFRQDLRLSDNPALNAALQKKRHVIPLFIHSAHSAHSDKSGDDKIKWQPGAASRWWLQRKRGLSPIFPIFRFFSFAYIIPIFRLLYFSLFLNRTSCIMDEATGIIKYATPALDV